MQKMCFTNGPPLHLDKQLCRPCKLQDLLCIRAVLLIGSVASDFGKEESENEGPSRTIYVISCLLIFPLTIALSVLLGWHIYLILRNKTTIEYYEGVRAMWLAQKGGEVYRHPYDLGPFDNLTAVLGPNILSWICPTSGHIGAAQVHFTAHLTTSWTIFLDDMHHVNGDDNFRKEKEN
ncbi:hypothetical protein KSS87_015073, partial [Heliosperma pusillum]